MAITGHLAEFSLAEIFQFSAQGRKTGLLTITPLPEPVNRQTPRSHYIWFHQGRIVAAANRSDGRGLMNLISQRGWLGDRAASRLMQSCDLQTPVGLCFKTQGALQANQLQLLFYIQVMQQVCTLFALEDGWFHFDTSQKAPLAELTGLNAPTVNVTLAGLRALKNWTALEAKLPDPNLGLVSTIQGKPTLKLKQAEWRVWEFTDGHTSLQAIAKQLHYSVKTVQQIAFRLIVASLAEEMPILINPPRSQNFAMAMASTADPVFTSESSATTAPVSKSFINKLVSFLKG